MVPERLRTQRAGIDRLLQHVLTGVIGDSQTVNLDAGELRLLLDALPVAVLIAADLNCTRIWGNAAARSLYQLCEDQNFSRTAPANELPPFEVYANGKLVDPQELPLQRAARTGEPVAQSECEIRFRDGRRVFIAGHSIPLRNEAGEVCGSVGAFLDLTPQRRELELSQIISREMSHRLRNTIAIIQSITRRTLKPLVDPQAYAAYEDRLISLSRYQDLLSRRDWIGASLPEVIHLAIQGVTADQSNRITASGPTIRIGAAKALTLSMIVHELATNAVKYGSLSVPEGEVRVTWELDRSDPDGEIRLTWSEQNGPPVTPPRETGFGTKMIAAVAQALPAGRLEAVFAPAGLSAELTFLASEVELEGPPEAGPPELEPSYSTASPSR